MSALFLTLLLPPVSQAPAAPSDVPSMQHALALYAHGYIEGFLRTKQGPPFV